MFTNNHSIELKDGPLDGQKVSFSFPWGIAEPSILYLTEGLGEGIFLEPDGESPGHYQLCALDDESCYFWKPKASRTSETTL